MNIFPNQNQQDILKLLPVSAHLFISKKWTIIIIIMVKKFIKKVENFRKQFPGSRETSNAPFVALQSCQQMTAADI